MGILFLNKRDGGWMLQNLNQQENFLTIRAVQDVSEDYEQSVNRIVQIVSEQRFIGDFLVGFLEWTKIR